MIKINKLNEVYLKLTLEDKGQAYEIAEEFSFEIPNARFNPKVKAGVWDGVIKLFNVNNHTIYIGLLNDLKTFLDSMGYDYEVTFEENDSEVKPEAVLEFLEGLDLPENINIRPYQFDTLVEAINKERLLVLSPTSSGKTLIQYMICRWFNVKTLIVVPTTTLVDQTVTDFASYGYKKEILGIMAGVPKDVKGYDIVVSTWQSIYEQPAKWFQQFEMVIGDEAHLYKSKSLTGIMHKCIHARYKFGLTGTIEDTLIDEMVLRGLFGDLYIATTTSEMIKSGYVPDVHVEAIVLTHKKADIPINAKTTYDLEVQLLNDSEKRNEFISALTGIIEGNTIVLFNFVEKHGKILYEKIKKHKKNVFFVHGKIKTAERIKIRKAMETYNDAVVIASYKTFGTGVSINNLHNAIFAQGYKGKVRVLQAIGRTLRLHESKKYVTLYDICDTFESKKFSYSMKHFKQRHKMYAENKFKFKLRQITL